MILSSERKGEIFVFSEAILWSFFPIITIISYNNLSPLISLAGSSFFAAIFFAVFVSVKHKWNEVKNVSAVKDILLATLFLGFLYYFLLFVGLKYTTAGNASIISLTEAFFSFIFFNIWKKEHLSVGHIAGCVLLVLGALIVLLPSGTKLHTGDILVLSAAAIAPFGNFFQRRARAKVSSEVIMFIRSIIVAILVFSIALLSKPHLPLFGNIKTSIIFFFVNGFILLGLSKVFWIEGIYRISVTKANALSSVSPLLTIFFAWLILKNVPTIWQFYSFIPLFIGILLLTKKVKTNQPELIN